MYNKINNLDGLQPSAGLDRTFFPAKGLSIQTIARRAKQVKGQSVQNQHITLKNPRI
jgi:hypothetical protein